MRLGADEERVQRRAAARRTRPAGRPARCRRRPARPPPAAPGSRCSPRTGAGAARTTSVAPYASATSEPVGQHRRVRAEPHGAAHVPLAGDDVDLVGHRGDHRVRGVRVELGRVRVRPARPAYRAASITMHCRPRHRPRAGMPRSRAYRIAPSLPSIPRTPKPPGISTPSTPDSAAAAPAGVLAVVGRHPADLHPGAVREAAGPQRLGDRQVRVRQVDVLADQRDRDRLLRDGAPGPAGRPTRSSRRPGTAGPAGAPRTRPGPRRAAPSGCRRWTVRPPPTTTASVSTSHISEILRFSAGRAAPGPTGRPPRPAGCRSSAARPPSAGSAWSSAPRDGAR